MKKTTYTDAKKRYNKKIKQYKVEFTLSDEDTSTVNFLENEREELGMSSNAYIKKILTDYVYRKYRE